MPFSQGISTENIQNGDAKTSLKLDKDVSEVNAVYKKAYKVKVWYKVKKKYKSNGKWKYRYVWKYKYVTKYKTVYSKTTTSVKTTTSTKTSSTKSAARAQLNSLKGKAGLSTLAKYINTYLNHKSGGAHTAAGVEKTGYGDCWGLSDWAAQILRKNGYSVKVVQGATSASSRHRWLQVKVDGKWTTFEPSLVTKKYGSKHYTSTCGKVSSVVASYNC